MAINFFVQSEWSGDTPASTSGFGASLRDHVLNFQGRPSLLMSSAPEYQGNPALLNPEELLVGAISSCQMLTFLAIASRSRLQVLSYRDSAEGVLEVNAAGKMAIVEVRLRPRIVMAEGTDLTRVAGLVDKAHDHCFIANSVHSRIVLSPEILLAAQGATPLPD